MCGRYSETVDPMELAAVLSIELCTYEFTPRPMIAPTQMAPVILRENGRTELRPMRWGLIPHWAEDERIGSKLINARSETAAQSLPSARHGKAAVALSRPLVSTNGIIVTVAGNPIIFIFHHGQFFVLPASGSAGTVRLPIRLNCLKMLLSLRLPCWRPSLSSPPSPTPWWKDITTECR